jgi:hypothetical protein
LDDGNRVCRVERVRQDGGVAEQNVEFDEHQFANGNRAGAGGQGGEEGAGVVIFRAVLIERVKQQVGVEGNHRGSVGHFVGQQSQFLRRDANVAQVAGFWELPVVIGLELRLGRSANHLFNGLAKQFWHGQTPLRRQAFDLFVNRVSQWHFGRLHAGMLPRIRLAGKAALGGIKLGPWLPNLQIQGRGLPRFPPFRGKGHSRLPAKLARAPVADAIPSSSGQP